MTKRASLNSTVILALGFAFFLVMLVLDLGQVVHQSPAFLAINAFNIGWIGERLFAGRS